MPRVKSWSEFVSKPLEEQKSVVREYRKSGMSDIRIGKELGVAKTTFDSWKTRNNMQRGGAFKGFPKKRSSTLCWSCKNFGGGCNWSREFEPVEGWIVVEKGLPTFLAAHNKEVPTIVVVECPEFIKG